MRGGGRYPSMGLGPQATCSSPRGCWWRNALCWVWISVLFWNRLFLGRGRGVCADFSCLVCFVLLLFNIVSMPGRGPEKPLWPPPNKLSHSEAKV